jgi:tetratricopeptide (TPR) repeat protein
LNLLRKDIDYIYNLQFNEAREVYSKIVQTYPGHPVVFLLRGIMIFWENYPLLNTNSAHVSFEEDMRQCIRLSERENNPVYEAEYLLANLCARGMLLMFYADNDLIMEVIPITTSTYRYLMHSFNFTSVCTDLYYFTGLYNYYREAYPKVYPVYESLALLFPEGDIEKGLKELQLAAINSVVLRAESYLLLSWIYLNFENKYYEALFYCRSLHELYPDNVLYLAQFIKDLLLMKKYDEAEKVYNELSKNYGQFQNKAGHPYGIIAVFQLYEIAREKKEEEKCLGVLLDLYKKIREGTWLTFHTRV